MCLHFSVGREILRNALRITRPTGLRMSSRVGCQKNVKDKCKITKFPCGQPEMQALKQPEKKSIKPKFKSMWLNPFCDDDEPHCPFNPRFDDIYYVESDKANRKYWQTWVACPPMAVKPKKICCFEKAKQPPLKRRKHRKPKTACKQPVVCKEDACPRFKRRCHRAGRIPPSCLRITKPAYCSKPLTPYPSFSECQRLRPGALPLSECLCWNRPMLCEVWSEWRKRTTQKKIK